MFRKLEECVSTTRPGSPRRVLLWSCRRPRSRPCIVRRGEERGGGQGGAGPAAPERSAQGPRSPLAPGRAAYLARHPLCVPCEAAGRLEPATVVDHVVPHRGDPSCSGTRATGLRCASPATTPRPRARAVGADAAELLHPEGTGGRSFVYRTVSRDRARRRLFMPAKFRRGVSGRSLAASAEFQPVTARRFVALS